MTASSFIATYRIQLSKDLTLHDVKEFLPYFHALGISHLYLSPLFQSSIGSMHGYDVTDFTTISEERGGEEALLMLDKEMQKFNPPLRLILDIVPNHMATSLENRYWFDVLEKGRASAFWSLFDMRVAEGEKINLPVISQPVLQLMKEGKLSLQQNGDQLGLICNDALYPLTADSKQKIKNDYSVSKIKDFSTWLQDYPQENLLSLLEQQHYRFIPFDIVSPVYSYRRFFDISGLIGIRVEDPEIYQMTHGSLFALLKKMSSVDGVRVDHIDGLADPEAYLDRLACEVPHIWVEKILSGDEDIPKQWPVEGTTGYEFIHHINQLLTHPDGFHEIENTWRGEIQKTWRSFADCVTKSKTEILHTLFMCELDRIAQLSVNTDPDIKEFWQDLTIALPVYRTYYQDGFSEADLGKIDIACRLVQGRKLDFSALYKKYLPLLKHSGSDSLTQAIIEWQQLSGPVMAKGLEDTAHYRYTPLVALNEVGCQVTLKDNSVSSFCERMQLQGEDFPFCMLGTSTHDTKRSEDARSRLYALAEMPNEWLVFYKKISQLTQFSNEQSNEEVYTEYFLIQSILSIWPLDNVIDDKFKDRIWEYAKKALRETKLKTTSIKPDAEYEGVIQSYLNKWLSTPAFIAALTPFAARLALCGAYNSLTVQTLKCLSPGLPDIYQGTEYWDFSLVDPDNRRHVDFAQSQNRLSQLTRLQEQRGDEFYSHLAEYWQDGSIKLWLTQKLLAIRRRILANSATLTIAPIAVVGTKADHVIAYRLSNILVVASRYPHRLLSGESAGLLPSASAWGNTRLQLDSGSRLGANLLMDEPAPIDHHVQNILQVFPVAVFECHDIH